eukprot:TRINITY_DN112810_c0_g1_i1.p1 TRINITY_DN112810_c0_g1~~TRINITY_DN112810_c0_g1_i1.p1  ORF type:complete len:433 (-),score=59.59 TRINITY_DN112810_c0_g1_i1:73-1371(-)
MFDFDQLSELEEKEDEDEDRGSESNSKSVSNSFWPSNEPKSSPIKENRSQSQSHCFGGQRGAPQKPTSLPHSETTSAQQAAGPGRSNAKESPPTGTPSELQQKCERRGLCLTWGPSEDQMQAMIREVEPWDFYGICALKDECQKRRIPIEGLYERAHVLARLYDVLVWQRMSLKQLQSECWRRKIPYVAQTRVSNIVLLETENQFPDGVKDLVGRLIQDAFPGTSGPLPTNGIPGVWTPGAGSFFEAQGSGDMKRVPAWTGTTVTGFEPASGNRSGQEGSWSFPTGPPPGAKPRPQPAQGTRPPPQPSKTTPPRESPPAPRQPPPRKTTGTSWKTQPPLRREFEEPPTSPKPEPEHFTKPRVSEDALLAAVDSYWTLGLPPGTELQEVRRTYKKLALKYHPDKQQKDVDGAIFKRITAAYEDICEVHTRAGG